MEGHLGGQYLAQLVLNYGDNVFPNQELYNFPVELQSATGAVIVRLKPSRTTTGALATGIDYAASMIASLGTNTVNSYTSSLDGFVEKFFSYNGVISPLPSSGTDRKSVV